MSPWPSHILFASTPFNLCWRRLSTYGFVLSATMLIFNHSHNSHILYCNHNRLKSVIVYHFITSVFIISICCHLFLRNNSWYWLLLFFPPMCAQFLWRNRRSDLLYFPFLVLGWVCFLVSLIMKFTEIIELKIHYNFAVGWIHFFLAIPSEYLITGWIF